MPRNTILVISGWLMLVSIGMAVDCPPTSTKCAKVPPTCASVISCGMDVEWFATYEGCKQEDKPVFVMQNFGLTLFTSNRQFKVKEFKKGTDDCDFSQATNVTDFVEPAATAPNFLPVHVLTATKAGCYHINLVFDDGCPTDPHIIVRQYDADALHLHRKHSAPAKGNSTKRQ